MSNSRERLSMPFAVYADKQGKKLGLTRTNVVQGARSTPSRRAIEDLRGWSTLAMS